LTALGLILMAVVFLVTYLFPDANALTRHLHKHWKAPAVRIPGSNKEITYDKYFLLGAIVLLVAAVKVLWTGQI
jgi:hypothetical protein